MKTIFVFLLMLTVFAAAWAIDDKQRAGDAKLGIKRSAEGSVGSVVLVPDGFGGFNFAPAEKITQEARPFPDQEYVQKYIDNLEMKHPEFNIWRPLPKVLDPADALTLKQVYSELRRTQPSLPVGGFETLSSAKDGRAFLAEIQRRANHCDWQGWDGASMITRKFPFITADSDGKLKINRELQAKDFSHYGISENGSTITINSPDYFRLTVDRDKGGTSGRVKTMRFYGAADTPLQELKFSYGKNNKCFIAESRNDALTALARPEFNTQLCREIAGLQNELQKCACGETEGSRRLAALLDKYKVVAEHAASGPPRTFKALVEAGFKEQPKQTNEALERAIYMSKRCEAIGVVDRALKDKAIWERVAPRLTPKTSRGPTIGEPPVDSKDGR